MKDQKFSIYEESGVYLTGKIENGCLKLLSEVYGEYDSEQHISLTKEETGRLFSLISPEDFIRLDKEKHLPGLDEFLDEHDIKRETFTI